MKQNERKPFGAFLSLGISFLVIGLATDNTAFSLAAISFIVISLVLGGRWIRPGKDNT